MCIHEGGTNENLKNRHTIILKYLRFSFDLPSCMYIYTYGSNSKILNSADRMSICFFNRKKVTRSLEAKFVFCELKTGTLNITGSSSDFTGFLVTNGT